MPLSNRLAFARINGNLVKLRSEEEPANLKAAYSIQEEVNNLLPPYSDSWKVGSTSKEAQNKLGTTEPGAARVPEQFRYSDGDTIPIFSSHDVWIEGEFAFRLGRNLPPRELPYSYDDLLTAIDGVAPSLELVGSRLLGGIAKSGRLNVTADGGANVALCIGKIINDWDKLNLTTQRVNLNINGENVASGLGSNALGDPLNVMVWLANHRRVSKGLNAGAIVSTGTCTGLVRVVAGDQITADFGSLGKINTTLIDAELNK